MSNDLISRQAAIDELKRISFSHWFECGEYLSEDKRGIEIISSKKALEVIEALPSAQPEPKKYEYHYDHTDCIWYRPEARNRCPATCAQYRDGWNDAMNYIFRDGKGYMPYRRDKQYGE